MAVAYFPARLPARAGPGPCRPSHLRIQAYAAKEFLFGFSVCFLFFFAVFFVNQILLMAEDILSKKAPLRDVILLLVYAMPSVIAMSFPFASLVGALMAAGRLSSDNEFLALMASGVPARETFLPFVILGLAFSIASFTMNDYFLPRGAIEFGKLYRKLISSTPALELKPWSVKRYADIAVVTGEQVGNDLHNLLVFDHGAEGKARVISASVARLVSAGATGEVLLQLEGVWFQTVKHDETDRFEWAQAKSMEYRFSTKDSGEDAISVGPREMASVDLARVIAEKRSLLEEKRLRREYDLASARAGLEDSYEADLVAGLAWANAAERAGPRLSAIRALGPAPPEDRSLQVYTLELYKKFSIPFGALCFVVLA
ncbi:MAG TPA: LptF/LptG family permease, partial [Rectinemataceae bacterium]|nr:LptF/LptG family permease [Rectinemataceae bacterium]